MQTATAIVRELKNEKQDREWYPTTDKILQVIKRNLGTDVKSMLDLGAGDGRVLRELCPKGQKLAVEQSAVLRGLWPADIVPVGNDFHQTILIDKKVDVLFCNPPYSEYVPWTLKILQENNAGRLVLVLPERWREQALLAHHLEELKRKHTIVPRSLGFFDFSDGDRQARARVEVVLFDYRAGRYMSQERIFEAFDEWFDREFPPVEAPKEDEQTPAQRARNESELIPGRTLAERLEHLYQNQLGHLLENFRHITSLDPEIFKGLDVSRDQIKENLQVKIQGLKHLYWRELFDNMPALTERLTSTSREKLLGSIQTRTDVDFTAGNALSLVIWAVKNANSFIDTQILDLDEKLFRVENVKTYKSTGRFNKSEWRYNRHEARQAVKHFYDYRFVVSCGQAINDTDWSYHFENNLSHNVHDLIADILIVARSLGYKVETHDKYHSQRQWQAGEWQEFDNLETGKPILAVKAHKNGNVHLKFEQGFMRRYNVRLGQLRNWIQTPDEAASEIGQDRAQNIQTYWKQTGHLALGTVTRGLLTE